MTQEKWNDSWFFSLGATYTMDETSKFHFGVAYDMTPVEDEYRTARIPDSSRYWLSAGYTYEFSPNLQGNVGYTYIFADKAKINEGSAASAAGLLTGEYDAHVNIVSASMVVKF
ncbi:MAG: outer membrane protein transport protein [Magnetospirillum sp.]|nr:outer membrane protein transport protein [Magnetospirillum sp.]